MPDVIEPTATGLDAQDSVTLKPSAIEKNSDEKPEDRMKRLNLSQVPYHTYETEQIAKDRAEELKGQEKKPYEYKANGYTVTEVEDENRPADLDPQFIPYKITADGGFEKVVAGKRNAEVYATTHAEAHKDLPATISKE